MPGHNKQLQQCESIARSTKVRCRAKGWLKKNLNKYRCKNHGGLCKGQITLAGKVKALKNLVNFRNKTDLEIEIYVRQRIRNN
jgi:hypothetical protein